MPGSTIIETIGGAIAYVGLFVGHRLEQVALILAAGVLALLTGLFTRGPFRAYLNLLLCGRGPCRGTTMPLSMACSPPSSPS